MRSLRATAGLGGVHAAGALVATGLLIASHGLLAGFLVAVALVAGRLLGALAAALLGDRRPTTFALVAAVTSLGTIAFAAVASTTVTLTIAAAIAAGAIGALTDVARQPSGAGTRDLVRAGASLGVLAALAAMVIVAGGRRAAEWRHGGFGGILVAAAVLVVVAVALGRPAGSEGPVIARGRTGPALGGAFRSACANMRCTR